MELDVLRFFMSPETNERKAEPFYQKYAWVILLAVGVLIVISGVLHSIGYNTDPATAEEIVGTSLSELEESNPDFFDLYGFYFRFGGVSDVGFGFLVAVIAATAYRQGRTWAWYTLLAVPAFFAASTVLFYLYGLPILAPIVFAILALSGLLLPVKKFFPRDRGRE